MAATHQAASAATAGAGTGLHGQTGTFTAGTVTSGGNTKTGYDPGNIVPSPTGAMGSALSPTTLPGGVTMLVACQDITTGPSNAILLYIGGWGVDPGKTGAFTTFNLTGLAAAKNSSAATYTYGGVGAGIALWNWPGTGDTVTGAGTKTYTFT